MTIRPYTPQDRQKLCDLFAELIENHKEYISHGELQMGIATDRGELAPDFRNAWLRYLDRQTADPETEIMLAEQDGTPTGFVIYGINRDGAAPYGMIYDVGLLPRHRSRGTGSLLVQTALDALREKGIADCYLESGVDNHSAHRFFEKFGFGQVSCIFRAKLYTYTQNKRYQSRDMLFSCALLHRRNRDFIRFILSFISSAGILRRSARAGFVCDQAISEDSLSESRL